MPEPIHFSEGFANILDGPLCPHTPKGQLASPWQMFNEKVRIDHEGDPIDWLRRVAGETEAKHEPLLMPHDRMAFLFDVRWETEGDKKIVREAHCQALIVDGAMIEDVILGEAPPWYQYLRADFEPLNLGVAFPDPLPHVHTNPKKQPRFPISVSCSAPHVDFIELVVRNFDRELWDAWAQRVWRERVHLEITDTDGERVDALASIVDAFDRNDLSALIGTSPASLRDVTLAWRAGLLAEKQRMTALKRDPACDVVSY